MALDLMNLLCLDPSYSRSPFSEQCRQIIISKTYDNSGDFVFNNLLQHFGRRDPNSWILLLTLAHDWSNYGITSAKCGFNLRTTENAGNISVIDIMQKFAQDVKLGVKSDYCLHIRECFDTFVSTHMKTDDNKTRKPITVMIDDLSILESLGHDKHELYKLVHHISTTLMKGLAIVDQNKPNHIVIQSSGDIRGLLTSMQNSSDIFITLRPLETGHSTRVDGLLTINDNRLPSKVGQKTSRPTLLSSQPRNIGSKNTYFYKLSDRRVRLTTSALIM